MRLRLKESYDYLHRALLLGEEANDRQVIGYAACWMSWTCNFLGFMDQGIAFGKKAQEMARFFPADHYLHFKTLAGIGTNYWLRGEGRKPSEIGKELLEYGRQHSHIRSIATGHICMAMSGAATGNVPMAIESGHMGAKIALDRFYRYWSGLFEATGYALAGQFPEAQKVFGEIASYSHEYDCDIFEVYSNIFLGPIDVAQGHVARGLATLEEARDRSEEIGSKPYVILAEFMLGSIHKQISAEKAENHFRKAIEVAQEIGAKGFLAQATLELGLLHKIEGKTDEARKCISDAVHLFEVCEADLFLKLAREALAALG
jgi:tetratricopeptide (TPR) repeat protein